jgi:hypothetical protein
VLLQLRYLRRENQPGAALALIAKHVGAGALASMPNVEAQVIAARLELLQELGATHLLAMLRREYLHDHPPEGYLPFAP